MIKQIIQDEMTVQCKQINEDDIIQHSEVWKTIITMAQVRHLIKKQQKDVFMKKTKKWCICYHNRDNL